MIRNNENFSKTLYLTCSNEESINSFKSFLCLRTQKMQSPTKRSSNENFINNFTFLILNRNFLIKIMASCSCIKLSPTTIKLKKRSANCNTLKLNEHYSEFRVSWTWTTVVKYYIMKIINWVVKFERKVMS